MRPIRLAVIFDQQIHAGGGYQQALNAALLTRELPKDLVDVTFFTMLKDNIETLASYGIKPELIDLSFVAKLRMYLRKQLVDARLLRLVKRFEKCSPFERQLLNHRIDLVYFLSPSGWANSLEELNYITTVWDLCHRDDPEFPEVRWERQFEARDSNYRAILPRAVAVFVDSELGKTNVVHRYGLDESRIHVIPFQASKTACESATRGAAGSINIAEKYALEVPYVFYPAQFWSHKNHVYLLEGLRELEQRHGLRIGAIFSGGDKGNRAYIEGYARELGLESRVRFAGFVSDEEIVELYRQSVALVMPTYFGPTNLPPLEAFELGVPVLYPDKAGLREQVGDAALLIDLKNSVSMADQLKHLIDNEELREQLIKNGRKRIENFSLLDRVTILRSVIEDFRWRRLCWA
jgi:glycosyltransferase involved in cell wall biosynthesis